MGKYRKCSIRGCSDNKSPRHKFPNPWKNPELFEKWLHACCNEELSSLSKEDILKSRKICHDHFTVQDIYSNTILKVGAFPSLQLPEGVEHQSTTAESAEDFSRTASFIRDHDYCIQSTSKLQEGEIETGLAADQLSAVASTSGTINPLHVEQNVTQFLQAPERNFSRTASFMRDHDYCIQSTSKLTEGVIETDLAEDQLTTIASTLETRNPLHVEQNETQVFQAPERKQSLLAELGLSRRLHISIFDEPYVRERLHISGSLGPIQISDDGELSKLFVRFE